MKRVLSVIFFLLASALLNAASYNISGKVTCGGTPVQGVLVSDGEDFVQTNSKGEYRMKSTKSQETLFIVTPSGYCADSKDGLQPAFWAPLSKAAGKETHDFVLRKEKQDSYSAAFISDLHLCSVDKRSDLDSYQKDIVPLFRRIKSTYSELGPVYTINLGDLSFEKFWYDTKQRKAGGNFTLTEVYEVLKNTEMPGMMYSVLGNHDHDGGVSAQNPEDMEFVCAHTYRETFGPSWYSTNIGGDHWIFINSVQYLNTPTRNPAPGLIGKRDYNEDLRPESLEWLKKDLEYVSKDTKVYFCTHCSLLFNEMSKSKRTIPETTKVQLENIFSQWGGNVQVFTGHRHRFDFCQDTRYPHLTDRSFPATSGDCWQTKNPCGENFSFDGTPQGVAVGLFGDGNYRLSFETVKYGEKKLKAYDEKTSVLVNYWLWKNGDVVEVKENGESRKVEQLYERDPYVQNSKFFGKKKTAPLSLHMFRAQLKDSTSLVEIIVRDKEGNNIARDVLRTDLYLSKQSHPRLFLTGDDFESMKRRASGPDDGSVFWYYNKSLVDYAGSNIGKPLLYKKDASGRRILQVSRNALTEIANCAWAYRMTGEKSFLDRAETAINAVCAFPDWNPSHYLDVGEMALAVSIGYDWLYNELKPGTKAAAVEALGKFALKTATDKISQGKFLFSNNWGQVCYGGIVCASIAVSEHFPEMSQTAISKAFQHGLYLTRKFYDPDGFYPEGPGYWQYGTLFQSVMMMALESALGTDAGLGEVAGFRKTALAQMFLHGPRGPFNYSDGKQGQRLAIVHLPELWYFARKYSDPSLAYFEYKLAAKSRKASTPIHVNSRLEVLSVINSYHCPWKESSVPTARVAASHGEVPIIVARTGWGSGDCYLGIKGGKANDNHAHMDGGSFIFDAAGVRWSAELGSEIYSNMEKACKDAFKTGKYKVEPSIWDRSQNSCRFQVFSYNNRQHSTITANDKDFKVDGRATIVGVIDEPDRIGGTVDMTELYGGELEVARRTAVIKGKGLELTDVLKAPAGKPAEIRWTLVSEAAAELTESGIKLSAKDRTAVLCASGVGVKYQIWTNDPRSRKTVTSDVERDFSRYSISGFIFTIPPGKEATVTTTLEVR